MKKNKISLKQVKGAFNNSVLKEIRDYQKAQVIKKANFYRKFFNKFLTELMCPITRKVRQEMISFLAKYEKFRLQNMEKK